MGKTPMPWNRWSATRLSLLLFKCPLSFYFEYVEIGAKSKVSQGIQKIFGGAIHHMLEEFFKKKYKSLERFIGSWTYFWLERTLKIRYLDKIRMKDPKDTSYYLGAGIAILKKFWYENIPYRNGELPMPQVEQRFNFRFKGHNLTGVMDRIQPVDGGVEIWDYKTGYKKPKEQELSRDVQFTFYNLAWLKQTGQNPIKMLLDHLSSGEQYIVPIRTEEDFMQLGYWLDEATIYAKNILEPCPREKNWENFPFKFLNPEDIERKHFPKRPGNFCGLCDYDGLCKQYHPTDSLREHLVRQELERMKTRPLSVCQEQLELLFPKKKLSYKQKSPQQ